MTDRSSSPRMNDTYSTEHPHEPEIPPALDAEGRCLICCMTVEISELKRELAASEARLRAAVALEVDGYAKVCCARCAKGEPAIFHAGYWRHMQEPTKVNATVTICEGWIECDAGHIRALSAPAISAEARRVVEDAEKWREHMRKVEKVKAAMKEKP